MSPIWWISVCNTAGRRFEDASWVGLIIMPSFASANAGAPISGGHANATTAVALLMASLSGKPDGVMAFSNVAVRLRLAVAPDDLPWMTLVAGSLLTSIACTIPLFIPDLGFRASEV